MNVLYPAIFEFDKSEKRYIIRFPDLAEAITEAETLAEAYHNANEVLTLTLEGRMDENSEIPKPGNYSAAKLIAPSARVQAALLIRWAKGKRKASEIAYILASRCALRRSSSLA